MILINVKFPVKPEHADDWPEISRAFTEATRAEPGNKWFEWYRSVEEPTTYVLIEAFEDDAAEAHVNSEHFATMQEQFPQYLSATPQIVSEQVESDGWGPMGEIQVD
ncbi:putative quinol monooxygenase [Kytococcus sedentarius]|uniref:putative quinol monooxygenase n=1 Tax=Kytococcus sedentarius TaxID=1276 RepID=UPI0019515200|nr:putative quinol monooxygenase [Kytococcus sedentarius]QRO88062.1 antibiotic biosynthesis monooxygenase [Kytococcus sedentarius]